MKKSNIILLILCVTFILFSLSFIIPYPEGWKKNENFLAMSGCSRAFEKLEEIDLNSGVSLSITEGTSNDIIVEGTTNTSDCFLYDQSLFYANFYCNVARYTVSYIKNNCTLKMIKSQNSKVYVENPDIRTLHLKLTNSQAIIKQNKNLRKL